MNDSPISLVILRYWLAKVLGMRKGKKKKKDVPPNHHTIQNVTPNTGHSGTELAKCIDGVVIKQIPHLVVDGHLGLRGGLIVMFQAIEPEAEDDHQVQAAERMLHTPVGGGGFGNPVDALDGRDLDAFEAGLDDLVHLLGPLDLLARDRHGRGDLVRGVIAQRLLDGLEIHFQTSARVAIDRHRVEDQRVALLRRAERHDDGLGLAHLERALPRLEREAQLVLGDDILQRLETALVVPDLQKQGVDQDAGGECAVPHLLALEQAVVGFADGEGAGGGQAAAPGLVVGHVQVPQRLGGGQLQVVDLVEAHRRRVVEGQREHAKEDVDGIVGPTARFVLDPLLPGGVHTLARFGPQLHLVPVPGHHVGEETLDGARPFQTLGVAAPAFEDHVQQGALHGPQRALAGIEVVLVLQELVDEHLRPHVEHEGRGALERVQGADRQDGQQQGRRGAGGLEGLLVQEGQMVVVQVEVRGQILVQGRGGRQLEGLGQRAEGIGVPDALDDHASFDLVGDLGSLG